LNALLTRRGPPIDNNGARKQGLSRFAMTKIFIVDDHPIVCDVLASMFEGNPAFEVVGRASSIQGTLAAVERCGPDLMLIDLSLEDGSGIHLVRALRLRGVAARVLVVTGIQSGVVAAEAFSAGVAGYVLKEQSTTELLTAIDAVAGGGTYVAPGLAGSWSAPLLN
jgi:DNA-binding NarL/FixJ family response regulator